MPPKPKFTKEEILDTALKIAEKDGMEAVVAREVAKKLGTTTSPIFTFFKSMDELKSEVYDVARRKYIDYLKESVNYFPAFKEFGFRFINFAIKNPKIYQMIFNTDNSYDNSPIGIGKAFEEISDIIINEIQEKFILSAENSKELFEQMLVVGNGIASLIISGAGHFTKEQISRFLSEACIGTVIVMKSKDGTYEKKHFEKMISSIDTIPIKRT